MIRIRFHRATDFECFRYTEPDLRHELLLEISELLVTEKGDEYAQEAQTLALRAIKQTDSGEGHRVLAEAFAASKNYSNALEEFQIAIEMFWDHEEAKESAVNRGLDMCAALHNPSLAAKIEQALSVAEMRKDTGVSD